MSLSEGMLPKSTPTDSVQPYPLVTDDHGNFIASAHRNSCLTHLRSISTHSGISVATWFRAFFQIVIALSTLGASVTFNYILSDFKEPKFFWSKPVVQTYVAVSWLLFLLALAFSSLASTILNFFQRQAVGDWDGVDGRRKTMVQYYASVTCLVLYGLIIAAFAVLGLVVTAYSPVAGWVAIGFTAVFGVGGLLCILIQTPLLNS